MTKLQIAAAVAGLAMFAGSVSAQDTQDGPTDNDLKAGYCFQVSQGKTAYACQRAAASGTAPALGQYACSGSDSPIPASSESSYQAGAHVAVLPSGPQAAAQRSYLGRDCPYDAPTCC